MNIYYIIYIRIYKPFYLHRGNRSWSLSWWFIHIWKSMHLKPGLRSNNLWGSLLLWINHQIFCQPCGSSFQLFVLRTRLAIFKYIYIYVWSFAYICICSNLSIYLSINLSIYLSKFLVYYNSDNSQFMQVLFNICVVPWCTTGWHIHSNKHAYMYIYIYLYMYIYVLYIP